MKTGRIIPFVCIVLSLVMMSSCSLGDALLSAMGFDTYDYESESVLEVLSADSEEIPPLVEMIRILTVNNPYMPEFDSSSEALNRCRDAILNYMLCTGFAKYMGNTDLIEKAQSDYPELRLISVIPAKDFENCVYTYFGGNTKVSHKSGELFKYLEKSEAYTAVTVPIESNIKVEVIKCEKTAKTYRLKFKCSLDGVESPVYNALIVNREDGSSYFKSLKTE